MERHTIVIHINEIINRAYGRPIGGLLWVVAVSFMLQGIASAQTELPPIIGDSLWTYTGTGGYNSPNDGPWGPWHALAEDSNLIFRVHWSDIGVHDATSGRFKEEIGVADVFNNAKARPRRVYANRWGNRLLIQYLIYASRGGDSLITALVSYPERKVLKQFQLTGGEDYFRESVAGISPDGRWVIAPRFGGGMEYELYDSQRDTSFALQFGGESAWSFDSASHQLAYGNSIIDLTTSSPTVRPMQNEQGPYVRPFNSQLSADGRFLIAYTNKVSGIWELPQVSVFECSTGKILWQLNGGIDRHGTGGNFRDDLISYALSSNGKIAYTYRNDTVNGKVIDQGFFYRLPDTIPIARSKPSTLWGFTPSAVTSAHQGYTAFSRDLTRFYVAAEYINTLTYRCWLLGMRFDELLAYSSAPESEGTSNSALYPNPTTGSVTLPWQWPDDLVHWQLLTTSGQMVTFGSSHVTLGNVSIDLSQELASGRYALLVRDASASHVVHQTVIKN